MIFIYVLTRSEGAAIAGAIIFPTGLLVTLLQSILSTIKMNSTFLNYTLFGITNKITDASGNFSIGVYIQCITVPLGMACILCRPEYFSVKEERYLKGNEDGSLADFVYLYQYHINLNSDPLFLSDQ